MCHRFMSQVWHVPMVSVRHMSQVWHVPMASVRHMSHARVNRYRAGAAIEPVNAVYRFHRK